MKIIKAIITVCLIGVILVCGYNLELKMNEYRTALDIHTERTLEVRKGRIVDFDKLKKQNKDVLGWIWVPGTRVDYPIVQGEDNDYYLHRDLDENYIFDGSIFVDALVRHPFSADENTVIYGHRMSSGAMFHDLRYYSEQDFFDKHKIIYIETPEKSYDLHVIAFCRELSDSDLYLTDFELMSKQEFIDLVKEKAVILSDEHFDESDRYVTLSTCAFSTGDERNQVIGVLKDASLEEKTVTTKEEKPFINKWLLMQIAVGLVMLLSVIVPLLPKKRYQAKH